MKRKREATYRIPTVPSGHAHGIYDMIMKRLGLGCWAPRTDGGAARTAREGANIRVNIFYRSSREHTCRF